MKEDQLLALIIKARDKNQKAQTQLINLFWVDVFSFVMNRVKDENDADEITVSVFSKVLNKLDLFDPNFQFKTWILTIAQNTIIDFWRRKSRERQGDRTGPCRKIQAGHQDLSREFPHDRRRCSSGPARG